jgi:hypothetical protein
MQSKSMANDITHVCDLIGGLTNLIKVSVDVN